MKKNKLISRLFGTKNSRTLQKVRAVLSSVNALEPRLSVMSNEELFSLSASLKERAVAQSSVEGLLPEAYALCREMSSRVMGMRHYDVQVMGGIILNDGNIAEMRTGEGKTLVASLPAYLNSLAGKQVHVVTVNDYLAKRDALLMMPLYEALGLRVGYLQSKTKGDERREIYNNCDIIYGTNSEFAFDFLRDNIAPSKESLLQKGLYYVIIDEVDSILIDEARTPLIISGEGDINQDGIDMLKNLVERTKYITVVDFEKDDAQKYSQYDVILSLKNKSVHITEKGFKEIEDELTSLGVIASSSSLYSNQNLPVVDLFTTMIRANYLFEKNKDYVVVDGKIQIINQNTGRIENGRRWSDGLHQAVEAKEGVEILPDNRSLASISLQNFFRLYEKISGMTGTADTDAFELMEVYGLDVVVVPTHKPSLRKDMPDRIYAKKSSKIKGVIDEIIKQHKNGRPVLVGTTSVEESEMISSLLKEAGESSGISGGIPHNVLNAKNHEYEASIVAMAGRPGAITIATNMAGRGTDIILGGNHKELAKSLVTEDEAASAAIKESCLAAAKEVVELGGLCVIGTSRNNSRRIDNQLIGRAGRQGDPGSSVFFVSLEDDLMKIFGGERYISVFKTLGVGEDECITHPFVDKAIRDSQGRIEKHHYSTRKELLKYDDINNMQRKEIYSVRKEWLLCEDVKSKTEDFIVGAVNSMVDSFVPAGASYEDVDFKHIENCIASHWGIENDFSSLENMAVFSAEEIRKYILDKVHAETNRIIEQVGIDNFNSLSRQVMIEIIDRFWIEQISMLDNLRAGIHLRGYAQKNPIQEYSLDSLNMFKDMIGKMKSEFLSEIFVYSNQMIRYLNQIRENAEIQQIN